MVWVVVTEGALGSLVVGVPAILAAVLLSLRLDPGESRHFRLRALPGFVLYFLYRSLVAGVDVAWRTVQPRPRLDPQVVEVTAGALPSGTPRWLLANLISLMPGTLSVTLEGRRLQLHCLYREGIVEQVEEAEARVARLFGFGDGAPSS